MSRTFARRMLPAILVPILCAATADFGHPKLEQQPRRPLVTLNVVATGAQHRPVTSLNASDIRISDAGRPGAVTFVHSWVSRDASLPPPGPHEYSNRPAGSSQSVLVLLDLLNANLAERGFAWNEIDRAFQTLAAGENLYVYLLTKTGDLYPIRALPGSGQQQVPASRIQAVLDEGMHAANRLRPWELQINDDARAQKTFAVLKDMASQLARAQGHKSLLWISHGAPSFPTGRDGRTRDYTAKVRSLGMDIAQQNITVYAVDQVDRSKATLDNEGSDTLHQLADATGGIMFASDSTASAIARVMEEGRAMYQVSYAPPPGNWDGRYHAIKISSDRKDVRLRTIAGYYADASESDPEMRFRRVASDPADQPDIGLRVTAEPSKEVAGWGHFAIRVNAADLQFETSAPDFSGELGITFAEYTDSWEPVAPEAPVRLNLTAVQREDVLRNGVIISRERPFPAGVQKVRIIVHDFTSGALGSVTIPAGAWQR